jgi:tetratricopeptide (TPR) repeat protein
MRSVLLASLLVAAAAAAAPVAPPPVKPGSALAAVPLPPCDYRPDYWTPAGSLSKPLAAGDFAAVEAELLELHASFERNHACERRMAWAFQHGFFTNDLSDPLDRWVAARPKSWTARTVRGAMWVAFASQLHDAWQHSTKEPPAAMHEATRRAAADLERAIALYPRAVVAHGELIQLHRIWHDPDRVEAVYRRAIGIDPISMHVLTTTATALAPRFGGSYERVAKIVAAARPNEQKNPRIVRLYGFPDAMRAEEIEAGLSYETRMRRDHLDPAKGAQMIRWYTQALRYEEPGSEWHFARAGLYRDLDQHAKAVADARFALAAKPPEERWWGLAVYSLYQLGRYDDALAAIREGLRHVPESSELRWYEADVAYRLGDFEKALELHRASLARARTPEHRRSALGGVGAALMKLERWAEAEPVLSEAAQIDPEHALTWHSIGEARWNLGRREEAVEAYETFLARSANKPWFDEQRMRAQEKIDLVRSGTAPPAAGAKPLDR